VGTNFSLRTLNLKDVMLARGLQLSVNVVSIKLKILNIVLRADPESTLILEEKPMKKY